MQTIEAKRDKFVKLITTYKEQECLEYINKYDGFYSATDTNHNASMLQLACAHNADQLAIALIDKNCDLTHQNMFGHTALMYASWFKLNNVVTHIIDKLVDATTRVKSDGTSEMMYLCWSGDADNVVKMIDHGYDIYYKCHYKKTLFTEAIKHSLERVVKNL
ncbi:MAG: hypothetical protein Faunusvirus64_4 [Faunusvirus sp.]|jgi:ankyrin repeat protein|uniref:Uncharacterized protein n=1 Tax=Faunusvirus sp. TaxID=2487766 RepID=A0A3G5A0S6_9VIRU|nr:MAG: hypothetical protein Faunusvirus64_4 [Faunusvirus sp.]